MICISIISAWPCLVLFLLFIHRLVDSRFGLIIRGASHQRAAYQGPGNQFLSAISWSVSSSPEPGPVWPAPCSPIRRSIVSPGLMHWTLSGELMVMVLLGGLGTLFGPVLGAAMFLLLEEDAGHVYRALDGLYGADPDPRGHFCQKRPVRPVDREEWTEMTEPILEAQQSVQILWCGQGHQ